ncbi:hypothetical protein DSCA_56120 [Desulfosarcina alkanivorans]|uniref:Uncharacterized protein n=1 Tax=Desulfosarcina alkanivorans TaxID=571177 RepID=A0A5K7YPG9_9BACT|nr:hypothetical protein [Desulfosarcina alkanivorans]BBO71682.1 hypothetical protein DSCA_56120 [Desulfosarcina alkanivorans]
MITAKITLPINEPIEDERRSGFDRRVLTYDWYIPERRTTADRRQKQQPCAGSSHGAWTDMRQYA